MLKVDLNSYSKRIRARMMELRSDITDVAVVRALNKTAAQAKTAASREIRKAGYNLKAAEVKKQITIRQATSGNPVAVVRCSGRPIPLMKFGARPVKAGVSVNVQKGRKIIKGAFIITTTKGEGVYIRVGNAHRKITTRQGKRVNSAYQLKQLYGPGIPDAFGNAVVQEALVRLVKTRFPDILAHEIKFAAR
jgi:hypothetical protein